MPGLDDMLLKIMERIGEIERRLANTVRHGPVTDVDAKKQLCRVRLNPEAAAGETDEPFKSAWIPYAQFAGDWKFHNPPTVGQNMTLFSPGGDPSQSIAIPLTWSDNFKSPGDKQDVHIITFGDIKITYEKKKLTIAVGKASITMETDKNISLDATEKIIETVGGGHRQITSGAIEDLAGRIDHKKG